MTRKVVLICVTNRELSSIVLPSVEEARKQMYEEIQDAADNVEIFFDKEEDCGKDAEWGYTQMSGWVNKELTLTNEDYDWWIKEF